MSVVSCQLGLPHQILHVAFAALEGIFRFQEPRILEDQLRAKTASVDWIYKGTEFGAEALVVSCQVVQIAYSRTS
jgi:hypothetical protein